jgi:hypothetical protein
MLIKFQSILIYKSLFIIIYILKSSFLLTLLYKNNKSKIYSLFFKNFFFNFDDITL